ncbi:hypothetical protein OSTOST_22695 [Ostertagia ostertagi]
MAATACKRTGELLREHRTHANDCKSINDIVAALAHARIGSEPLHKQREQDSPLRNSNNEMADDAEINEQQDEVPMEPEDAAGHNEQPQQQQLQEAPQVQQLQPGEARLNRDHEEIPLMHRKIQRILGRTDDLNSMRNQVDSTYDEDEFSQKGKEKTEK